MKIGSDVVVNNFGPISLRGKKSKVMELSMVNGEISDVKTKFGWLPKSQV